MQLQMEVCNLDECDFLETYFKEFENLEVYLKEKHNYEYYGIILMFNDKNCNPIYEYMPLYLDNDTNEFDKWKKNMMEKNNDNLYIKEIYYYLDNYSCVLVKRNKEWFNSIIDNFKDAYNIILNEKNNNKYIKRIENKKNKKNKNKNNINNINNNICLINTEKLVDAEI